MHGAMALWSAPCLQQVQLQQQLTRSTHCRASSCLKFNKAQTSCAHTSAVTCLQDATNPTVSATPARAAAIRHRAVLGRVSSTPLAAVSAQQAASTTEPFSATIGGSAPDLRAAAHQQSLDVLEWRAVCRQVAAFCGTSVGSSLLQAGQLPLGSSQADSELLLQQTAEAQQAQLKVTGVFDLRPALEAAAAGGILNARQLEGVAASMEAAFELRAAAAAAAAAQQEQGQQQYLYPALAQLASGIQERELNTLRAIRSCISDGSVLSEASQDLAAVRQQRSTNRDTARALATRIARELYAQGAAEGRDPLLQRRRYCVAVKRSSRSALSKGSVKLGQSGTGATLYLEPVELLEVNNQEAALADAEAQAELAVLQALSQFLAERSEAIQGLLAAVTQLDIVAARAQHATWCMGVRPIFLDSSSSSTDTPGTQAGSRAGTPSPLHLPGARHPLLLQPSLPPLPRPPSDEDGSFETDFVPPPLFALTAAAAAASTSSTDSDSDGEQGLAALGGGGSQGLVRTAKPLDIRVPGSARVVAITGPNTGGKTVTLKTAGLLVLMAKAGLFLPCDQQQLEAAAVEGGGQGGGSSVSSGQGGGYRPQLLWFDQVLADIGDSQSLQQNLSTFSGHITRLKLLLAAAGGSSLVLLDEVGSGTDPLEGSALARAVLDQLAGQARLTLATSHHAELKTAAEEDSRYVNVSLEFNTLTLQPTYRLLWGAAGASNALDIADALGFDARVVADARVLARQELGRQEEQQGRMEQVAASVSEQLSAARARIDALTAERQQKEAEGEVLRDAFRRMLVVREQLRARERLVRKEAAEMVIKVQQAAVKARQGSGQLEEVQAVVDSYANISSTAAGSSGSSGSSSIRPGDFVVVPSMGVVNPFVAQVVKVSGDSVWVEGGANPLWQRRNSAGTLTFRLDQVVPATQLQLPGMTLEELMEQTQQQEQGEQQQEEQQQQQQPPERENWE